MKRIAAALLAVAVAVACGATSHIYPARRFDRTRGCVNPISALDVLDGDNPGSLCDIVCLVATRTDGGPPDLWISSECAPYPPFFDTSGADPDCARAIDIYKNGPSCFADGGIVEAGPGDGGGDGGEGGSLDAAPADATSDGAGDAGLSDADAGAG